MRLYPVTLPTGGRDLTNFSDDICIEYSSQQVVTNSQTLVMTTRDESIDRWKSNYHIYDRGFESLKIFFLE
jgi:hypothetical protein